MCIRKLAEEYLYKLSRRYLWKLLMFAIFNAQNGRFLRYLWEFRYFSDFQFLSDLGLQKVFYGHFFRSWRKSDRKTLITLPILKILNLTFFDPVTLDDLELSQGHKRLRRVLRSILDTIHAVPSALFQFDTTALPGEASNDKK